MYVRVTYRSANALARAASSAVVLVASREARTGPALTVTELARKAARMEGKNCILL